MCNNLSTKWARKTANRIISGNITEAELIAMRKIMKNAVNHPGHASASADDVAELIYLIETRKPFVSLDQAIKGMAHLTVLAFRKDGTQRQTPDAQELLACDLQVIRQLRDAPSFRLVGLYEEGRNGWVYSYFPIYRAIASCGNFDYVAPSWQSGRRFQIISRGVGA